MTVLDDGGYKARQDGWMEKLFEFTPHQDSIFGHFGWVAVHQEDGKMIEAFCYLERPPVGFERLMFETESHNRLNVFINRYHRAKDWLEATKP